MAFMHILCFPRPRTRCQSLVSAQAQCLFFCMNPLTHSTYSWSCSKYRRTRPRAVSGVAYGGSNPALGPNIAGNANSWGISSLLCVRSLFPLHMTKSECVVCSYNQLKRRATGDAPDRPLIGHYRFSINTCSSPPKCSHPFNVSLTFEPHSPIVYSIV